MWLGVDLGTNTKNTMPSKKIRLHAQSKITLQGLIVSKNWRTCRITSRAQEYSLWWWIIYSYELQILWGKWLQEKFGFANHLGLISCFISYKKWVQIIIVYLNIVNEDYPTPLSISRYNLTHCCTLHYTKEIDHLVCPLIKEICLPTSNSVEIFVYIKNKCSLIYTSINVAILWAMGVSSAYLTMF